MSIGEGHWTVFVQRPASAVLLAIVVAVLVVPMILSRRRRDAITTG
jgi:putative tricarboxylic transport membrane protein